MRTTKKEFKEQIREHILACLSDDVKTDVKEQLQNVVCEFHSWYGPYEQKRTPNKHEAFKGFLLGLPSCFNAEFTHYGISQTLKGWFERCGETYKEQEVDKEVKLYYHLVTREFQWFCQKNGVDF